MSKRQGLMLIGVWVLILAVPGFPPSWKTALLVLTGSGIIWFGYAMRPASSAGPASQKDLPFADYKRPQNDQPAQPTATNESDRPVA